MAKLKSSRVYGNLTVDEVLLVSTDATITGNLTVIGTTTTVNSTTVQIEGPIVQQGAGNLGASLTSDDGKDRGLDLSYYAGGAQKEAFIGWNTANSEFAFGDNVTILSDVVTFNTYGNVRALHYLGQGDQLANITGSNVTGWVAQANYANYAGTVVNASQGNITSLGTLTGLDVSGQSNLSGVIANGAVSITNTTVSTSDTTGALKVAGGAGVVGNLWVGGTIYGNVSGSTQAPGANTDIVFNDGGTSNATGGFTFNKLTNTVTVGSNITLSGDAGDANIGGNLNLTSSVANINGTDLNVYGSNTLTLQGDIAGHTKILLSTSGVNITTPAHGAGALTIDSLGNLSVAGTANIAGNLTVGLSGNVNSASYGSFTELYITNASGSDGQINYIGSGGVISGDSSLTYNGTTLYATNLETGDANITGNVTLSGHTAGNLLTTDVNGNLIDSDVSLSGGTLDIGNANIQNLEAGSLQLYNLNNGSPIAGGILFTDNGGNVKDSNTLTYTSNTLSAGNITTAGTANVATLVVTSITNNEIPFANSTSGISGDASFTYTLGTGTFNAPNITANSNITTSTGTISGANIVDTNLIGTEVVFAGTGGKLQGNASFTYTAGTLTANMMNAVVSLSSANIYDTDLNLNSVVFAAAGGLLTQDSGFAYYTSNSTLTASNVSATNTVTAANVLAGNIGNSTSTLYGNGINISNIAGANVSGTVANANYAAYAGDVVNSSQSNITSVGTLTSLSVSGTGSITGANLVSANYVTGTLTTNAQPNITSVGTLTSLTVAAAGAGNITADNILTDGLYHANGTAWDFAKANGAATDIQFKSSSGDLQGSANFTYDNTTQTFTVGGSGIANVTTLNATTGNITTVNSTNLNATGDIVSSSGNIHANIDIQADGNVNAGSTVNTVDLVATGFANITGYMKAGDTTITGNLVVTGTTTSVNTTTTQLEDPLIDLGLGANGAVLTHDDGKDRGMVLHTYNGSNSVANDIFMGWKDTLGAFVLAQNVTVTSSVVNYGTGNTAQQANLADLHLGNIYAYNANFGGVVFSEGNITLGSGSYLNGDVHGNISGNIKVAGANGSIQFATNVMEHLGSDVTAGNFVIGQYYKIDAPGTTDFTLIGATNSSTGTYFTANGVGAGTGTAKPSNTYGDMANDGANLEYVGGNLTVNVTNGGYVITDHLQGTIETANQPNITSVGTLTSLTVAAAGSGNILADNILTNGLYHANGTAWDFATAAGPDGAIQISTSGDLANVSGFTYSSGNLNVPGNIVTGTGSGGNITGANEVHASAFFGDGGNLSNINGSNVSEVATATHVTAGDQGNITSVGTLTSLTVTGDISSTSGNITAGNIGSTGSTYLYGDGSNITGVTASYINAANLTGSTLSSNVTSSSLTSVGTLTELVVGNSTANATFGNGTITLTSAGNLTGGNLVSATYLTGTLTTRSQPNVTSVGTLTSLEVAGDITSDSGNIVAGIIGNATTMLYGNGINISNIAGANVSGTVANANYAAYAGNVVNASQSNITSVGTLTSLSVTNNITSTLGNIVAGNIGNATTMLYGNGINISNIAGANVSGYVANADIANTAYSVNAANLTGSTLSSNVTSSSLTSLGTLTSLTVSGTTNLGSIGNVTITGGTDGQYLVANGSIGGLKWASVDAAMISNGTSNVNIATTNGDVTISVDSTANVVDISSLGMTVTGVITATGNITGDNIISNNAVIANSTTDATSAVTGAITTAGGISAQGNIYTGHAIGFANTPGSNTSSAAYIQFNSGANSLDFIFN